MAQVGGISVAEMNKLEIELCLRLNWELHLAHSDYAQMLVALVQPTHQRWTPWQHTRGVSSAEPSADDARAAADTTSSVSDMTPKQAVPVATHAVASSGSVPARPSQHTHLPLWASGANFRREAAPAFTRQPAAAAAAGTSPAASVSVR